MDPKVAWIKLENAKKEEKRNEFLKKDDEDILLTTEFCNLHRSHLVQVANWI